MDFPLEAEEEQIKEWFLSICQFQDKEDDLGKYTIFISYRGRWCMYCRHYLQQIAELKKTIGKSGGRVVAFCSQNQIKADEAKEHWELPFDYIIGDPENRFAKMLKANDYVQPIITGDEGDEGYTGKNYVSFARKRKHMHGIVQPSLLIMTREMVTIFNWRIDPSLSNAQGAGGRPDIKKIVNLVVDKMKGKIELEELTTLEELNKSGYKVETVQLYNPKVLWLLIQKLFGKA